jgi:hypothetical protein
MISGKRRPAETDRAIAVERECAILFGFGSFKPLRHVNASNPEIQETHEAILPGVPWRSKRVVEQKRLLDGVLGIAAFKPPQKPLSPSQ